MQERTDELAWLPMAPGDVATVNTVGDGEPVAVEVELPARSVGWLQKTQPDLVELIVLAARVADLTAEVETLRTTVLGCEVERLQSKLDGLRREAESAKPNTATAIRPRLELTDRARILRDFFGKRGNDHG